MQRHWIGKSVGARIDYPIVGEKELLSVFTTRHDTVYGATFMVLAPEHPLALGLSAGTPQEEEVRRFCEKVGKQDTLLRTDEAQEKIGVFTGRYALNPMTNEEIPIWVANFVLMEYGTGAIQAVPAHDQRDLDFARKYGLSVRVVVQPPGETPDAESLTEAYVGDGVNVNSGPFDGLETPRAKEAIADALEGKGLGEREINYRLRDWGISRQRYWGTPIPMIHCDGCGVIPVPETELPVVLPVDIDFRFDGTSPLSRLKSFHEVACPKCGKTVRSAAKPPNEIRTRWTPLWILRGIFADSQALTKKICRSTARPVRTGWMWTSTLGASNTPFFICFMPGFSPGFYGI
jgi:leucyl-tRNA synthetase